MFDKLADPLYRLNNLYYITDKTGKKVKFKMTAEQLAYFQDEHHKNIILKARQLGFTTQVCIMQLDCALFESKKCALIAHTLHDAKRLFREKVKFAYDNLPELVRLANPVKIETKEELVFENGGSVTVSTSFRGGTLQRLHVSEFGKICAKYPDKAREIVTGAFEAVPIDGIATLESTAEGRQGYFFEYCQQAEKDQLADKDLTAQDWRFFFFAWWQNPEYQMPSVELPERLVSYFSELKAKHGISTTAEQQAWYYAISDAFAEGTTLAQKFAGVATATTQGMKIVSAIQQIRNPVIGQAHDGIMSVPKSGTWNLEKGERVLPKHTAKALDDKLASMGNGKAVNVIIHNHSNAQATVEQQPNGDVLVTIGNMAKYIARDEIQKYHHSQLRQGGIYYGR
ncbi:hypothetical protein LP109_08665 [Moraxella bovis]|uniref:hypothetical protein n=1 Tax=Moraxella bovis TaxID=476 RepID=UPI001FD5C165|nr:hypothetical protein [Moraxella bovis]UZA15738.1 hypothetical protein LP109_08665 [Moraxella bovis]